MTVRFCPDCGEAITVPDDLEIPAGAVVRHEPGECPASERVPQYRYELRFTAVRRAITDDGDGEEEPLASIAESMVAANFTAVAMELSKRVGARWDIALRNTALIDD